MKFISWGCWMMGDPNNSEYPLYHLFEKLKGLNLEDYDFIMITGDNYYEYEDFTLPEYTQFLQNIEVPQRGGGTKKINLKLFRESIRKLKIISQKIPVYICLGNHDWALHVEEEEKKEKKLLKDFLNDAIAGDEDIPHQCRVIVNGGITESDYPSREGHRYNCYVIDTEMIEGGENHGEDVKASEVESALAYFMGPGNGTDPIVIFGHVPMLSLSYKEVDGKFIKAIKKENKRRMIENENRKEKGKLLPLLETEAGIAKFIEAEVFPKNWSKGSFEPSRDKEFMIRQWQVSDLLVKWISDFVEGMVSDKRDIVYICADTHNFQESEIMFSRGGKDPKMVRQMVLGSGGTYPMDGLVSPDPQSSETDVNSRIQKHFNRVIKLQNEEGISLITSVKLKKGISGLHGIGLFDTSNKDGNLCKFEPYYQKERTQMKKTTDKVLSSDQYYEGMSKEVAGELNRLRINRGWGSFGGGKKRKSKRRKTKRKSKRRKTKRNKLKKSKKR